LRAGLNRSPIPLQQLSPLVDTAVPTRVTSAAPTRSAGCLRRLPAIWAASIILVNNTGRSQAAKFEELTDEIWQGDFDLKVFAATRFARLAFPGMKSRRWGRIINVLNIGAKAPGPGSAPTTVMRSAGMALTKILAGEGAPYNVLANALMTGLIVSDQWSRRHQSLGAKQPFEEFLEEQAKAQRLPMGRFGTAEEFANIACFLASDAASYISGTAINVDGAKSPVM
jgi:NAD(P)-dependent dehydrogenase (short-subunit alcohol dehydrogenase family)